MNEQTYSPAVFFGLILAFVVLAGCVYTPAHVNYNNPDALAAAMNKNHLHSIKALISVNMHVNGRYMSFPESIIIDGNAMRLETLNIFYQPVLIIIYNGTAAVMDVNKGTCSISSSSVLRQYTRMDVEPVNFERLITARLIGKPDRLSDTKKGIMLYGKTGRTIWSSVLNDDLLLTSTTAQYMSGDTVTCTYKDHDTIDGVTLAMHVTCDWGDNRVAVHYKNVRVNVPVDSSLMDTHKLCGYD
ncbi:MAG: hypothetical protein M1381_05950 [Deltaproteobacteria bacterium]|nr:hypothetical protein [Deltaproteobacteria bacterium]